MNGSNYVYLDVRPKSVIKYAAMDGRTNPDGSPYLITADELLKKLPDIVDFNRVYLGIDPMTQMMPIQPTAHYTMGGIPTNKYGEVIIDDKNTLFPGLYAARMRVRFRARSKSSRHELIVGPGSIRQALRTQSR